MDCYTEFYYNDIDVSFRVEYYLSSGQHFAEYSLDKESIKKLLKNLNCINEKELLKIFTKRYSSNNEIFDLLKANSIEPTLINKGYSDTSADV